MNKENNLIHLTIDGKEVEVEKGTTILEAARKVNIDIPTLCFLKDINENGDCRMCIVEVEGRRGFATSCIQKAEEGMVVHTHTKKVVDARKMVLDLTLSNHHRDCLTCIRSGNCELQALAIKYNVQNVKYDGEKLNPEIDDKSPAIVRDFKKCILCRRCVSTCKKVQDIGAIDATQRGFSSCISTVDNVSLKDSNCVYCGQCIESCPTGALHEKEYIDEVWEKLYDKSIIKIAQTAPAVRVGLGEEFNSHIGEITQGKMVTALKRLGFDKVFDTNTGADFTIMEEANEFVDRIKQKKNLPMITSCCPAWVRFAEKNFPGELKHLSTCKSPHQMFGAVIKSYYAKKYNIDPSKICVVSIMPCIAKKYEAQRPEMEQDGIRDVDLVITTRELARMIKQNDLDFANLEESNFDDPMGEATGAGAIFGTTGGVMEAALRTAADILEGTDVKEIEYKDVRGEKGIKEAKLNIAGKEINIAVASGLKNARKIMNDIKDKKSKYDFIEIMACPGGCIMGGGQPIKSSKIRATQDVRKNRADSLYTIDERSKIRKSHQNPTLIKIYKEFFEKPGGEIAHKYLHTDYKKQNKYELK